MAKPSCRSKLPSLPVIFLQFAGLTALGLAQPLLDLVRRNPEFLLVHHAGPWDMVIMVSVLFLLPPLLLSVIVMVAGLIHARARAVLQAIVLGGLMTVILLPVADKLPAMGGWLSLAVAAIPAAVFALVWYRSGRLRDNLVYVSLSVPVLLIVFLGSGPIRTLFKPSSSPVAGHDSQAGNPVVVIIFDELPVTSLMGLDQEIDRELFPNFARLADTSTWYRNATTVSPATLRSIPAILSGRFPVWLETPSLGDHPQSIFTLLGSSHEVSALESQTSLCPPELRSEPVPRLGARLNLLFDDLSILYRHIVVPHAWRGGLIPVADKWGEYRPLTDADRKGRRWDPKYEEFEGFVSSLETGDKPNLVVAHVLLPHTPFHYLPDGRIFTQRIKTPVTKDGSWGPDELVMTHSFRRHLLQLMAVDGLVGTLLDRLEDLDVFDDAAIVITSDHGAGFRTGFHRRRFDRDNAADILSIPLLMKMPGQTTGAIDDRFAQTIDIMPTLTAALGCTPDWEFDGVDLLSGSDEVRTELDFLDQDAREHRRIDPARLLERNEIIRWKHDLFGSDGGMDRLFTLGDDYGLRGRALTEFEIHDHPVLRGRILDAHELEAVDLTSGFLPAEVNGILKGHQGNNRLPLALALNGRISAVTETYLDGPETGTLDWQAMAAPSDLQDGINQADLFLVVGSGPEFELQRIPLFTPSFVGADLGGVRVSGIGERGLYEPSDWDGRPARWTDGRGTWRIPLKQGEEPKFLTIGIASSGPLETDLIVTVNGTRLLRQILPRGAWETRLPLDNIKPDQRLDVVLKSSVFVPAECVPNSTDHRELGVAVTTLVVK